MTTELTYLRHRLLPDRLPSYLWGWSALVMILVVWLPTACTRFSLPDAQRDSAAQEAVARLQQTNAGLTRFKCVGKMTLSGPDRPAQSFRAAMAGQLANQLRIDMLAPFGGSAGTVSSDGNHLFLVMHPSHEYYKRRFGSGSLRRIIQINVTVGDLLELLMGRIPMDGGFSARLMPDEDGVQNHLALIDQWGRTRQLITVDSSMHPLRVVWFDGSQNPAYTLMVTGQQTIDGFVLPKQIDLSAATGERVWVALDRYEANVVLDESVFILVPPTS